MAVGAVEFLLSGFTDNSGEPLNGGKVYSYSPGTTTAKPLYTDSLGVTPAANPVVLDSNGRAQVYAEGAYKLEVKTSANVLLYTFDNLLFVFPGYATTQAEMSAINTAGTQIIVGTAITLTGNLTLTAPLRIEKGGSIATNGFTLTINGPFECGAFQCFTTAAGQLVFGAGSVKEILPEWFGAVGDGSINDAPAIQLALTIGGNYSTVRFLPKKIYKVSSTLTIPITRDYQTLIGYGSVILGAVNGNILTISDNTTTNEHANFISILGLEFVGAGDTDTTYPLQNGIEIDAIIGCTLRDVIVREMPQTGIIGTKSPASGSGYWNKVVFDNVSVRFCGAQTINIGTASAVDDLICLGCIFNHGGSQITTSSANGSAYIKAISLSMIGCEISGNYSETTPGAGYRWGMHIESANGVLQGLHFEINGANQAGSADLLLDTSVSCLEVFGCGFYGSSLSAPKFAIQDKGKNNRFDAIAWTSDAIHAYDYIMEVGSSTNCHIGTVASLNSPVVGPNTAVINGAADTFIERTVQKGVTGSRPTPLSMEYGRVYLDTTLDADGMPIFWQGTKWIKSDGTNA